MQISMGEEIFDDKYKEEVNEPTGLFLKAVNFEGEGLVVKLVSPVKRVKANDPRFGDKAGLTNEYEMEMKDGTTKVLTSSSPKLAKGLIDNQVQTGDWCRIKNAKVQGDNDKEWTEWTVAKIQLEAPDVDTAKEFEAEPKVNEPPF